VPCARRIAGVAAVLGAPALLISGACRNPAYNRHPSAWFLCPIDRLHYSHASEHHRPAILRSLLDANGVIRRGFETALVSGVQKEQT